MRLHRRFSKTDKAGGKDLLADFRGSFPACLWEGSQDKCPMSEPFFGCMSCIPSLELQNRRFFLGG
jgi:hypothetical protein